MSEQDRDRHPPKGRPTEDGMAEDGTKGPEKHAPRRAEEQKDSTPERPIRPDEEAGESVEQLEDPPQAEGERGS